MPDVDRYIYIMYTHNIHSLIVYTQQASVLNLMIGCDAMSLYIIVWYCALYLALYINIYYILKNVYMHTYIGK